MKKVLIIRFSSIGDIIQCISVVGGFKNHHPNCVLHWVVRKDFAGLLKIDSQIDRIWEFDKTAGISGLIKLGLKLRREGYTHIYDAHSNIRSNILKIILCTATFFNGFSSRKLITRRKHRLKRLLLFKFQINLLPRPFKALESFRSPLKKWGITNFSSEDKTWVFPKAINQKVDSLIPDTASVPTITLVPSAAWELKRWPVKNWQKLVRLLPDYNFIVLGGPDDHFCEEIKQVAPARVFNLAGATSLMESFCVTFKSTYVISGDTGFLHAADLFNKEGLALIGPTAFGYPSGIGIKVMEISLPCRPCSKDGSTKCKINENKKCMLDITPEGIVKELLSSQ